MSAKRYELWWDLGGHEVQYPRRTVTAAEVTKFVDQAVARDGVWVELAHDQGWTRRYSVAGYRLKEVDSGT